MKRKEFFERGVNSFGYKKWSPLVVFTDEFDSLRQKIKKDAIKYLFADKEWIFDDIERICRHELEQNGHQLPILDLEISIERKLHFSQNHNGFVNNRVKERCYRIKDQLIASVRELGLEFQPSDNLIDMGAGSGLVAQLFKQELGLNYTLLTDVVDYRYPDVRNTRGVDFHIFKAPFCKVETEHNFQVGIITNTLHHCDEPFTVFKALADTLNTGALLFVVESCIGVTETEVSAHSFSSRIPYQTLYNTSGLLFEDQLEFLALNEQDKMIHGSFFDWIYNRVFLNENINVPYNFGTPSDWNLRFSESGFEVLKTFLMGFDQPAALEFHTLHVLKKLI